MAGAFRITLAWVFSVLCLLSVFSLGISAGTLIFFTGAYLSPMPEPDPSEQTESVSMTVESSVADSPEACDETESSFETETDEEENPEQE